MNSEEAVLHADFTLYAGFLLQHLEEATEAYNRLLAEYGLDSLLYEILPGAKTNEALQAFLQALVEGKAVAYERHLLNAWGSTLTAEQASVQSLQMLDTLLVKKLLLVHFLPHFTSDPQELASLSAQIEKLHHLLIKQLFEIAAGMQKVTLIKKEEALEAIHEQLQASQDEVEERSLQLKATNDALLEANESLTEKERIIEKIAETSTDFIYIFDLTLHRTTFANRNIFWELLGISQDAFYALDTEAFKQIFYPGDFEKREQFYQDFQLVKAEEMREVEISLLHGDGRYHTFLLKGTVFRRTAEGIPDQVICISQDITRLKQSEIELRHSLVTLKNFNEELQTINQELAEQKYFIEQVTHTIPSYIFIFDLLTFTASYFNRDLLEDLGYPLEEIKARGLSMIKRLFYPGDYEKRNHFYGSFIKEKDQEIKELELRILHSDGQYRAFLIRNTVFKRDSEGVPNQVIGIAQDITQLKQTENDLRKAWLQLNEANEELTRTEETLKELNNELEERIGKSTLELAASNERFELVAQATNDAIWDRIYGQDYIHWNQSFEQIFGYIGDEEKNNPSVNGWFERMHPEDREGIRQSLEQSIYLGNTSWGREYRFLRSDGTYAYVLSRAVILYDNQQNPQRLVGSMMDISHLKDTEFTLQKRNEELIKINADLDNFIYVASHDLKHPVTNLEGLLAMLREHLQPKEDAESEKWLNLMDVSTVRLRKTIQDIAEISKVQKGLEEAYEVLNFEHILDEIKIDIFNLISQAGAIIYTDFQVKEISYSHKNLRSILYNLLSNALKYRSPDRLVVVQLATYWHEGNIILTVQDNGLGLNPQQQAKLFTMFKRLHTHVEGTGIGLYMIKRIIENNGGKIFVTSESQVGTTFTIQFKPTFAHEKT
jgi:PAS domain S-box-containing protein